MVCGNRFFIELFVWIEHSYISWTVDSIIFGWMVSTKIASREQLKLLVNRIFIFIRKWTALIDDRSIDGQTIGIICCGQRLFGVLWIIRVIVSAIGGDFIQCTHLSRVIGLVAMDDRIRLTVSLQFLWVIVWWSDKAKSQNVSRRNGFYVHCCGTCLCEWFWLLFKVCIFYANFVPVTKCVANMTRIMAFAVTHPGRKLLALLKYCLLNAES